MNKLNENIFHQYNKWKKNYIRKENSIKFRLNNFLDRNPLYRDKLSISKDGNRVNCSGNIYIYDEDLIDAKFPFPFGTVYGDFNCDSCRELISLEGAPEEVRGSFFCSKCSKLTSLVGAPEKVEWDFYCYKCNSLISLEGVPKEIGGNFESYSCPNLISLVGAPEKVGGDFKCTYCNNLTSLEGAPKEVGRQFYTSMVQTL